MKLHLGCGQQYLEGYLNVDYPSSAHTVQKSMRADVLQDLTTLTYPAETIEEIRLHHVFEHFSRPVALALLCRWRDWLVPGGRLRIETPDLKASAWLLVSPFTRYEDKQEVIRHLFGSHEADWAVHWDGWYADRFVRTLGRLGYDVESIQTSRWQRLRNVEVIARKGRACFEFGDYRAAASELLGLSTVKLHINKEPRELPSSEAEMLAIWITMWEKAYLASSVPA